MIRLTWHQFRPQAVTAAIALAVAALVVAVTRPGLATAYTSSGLPDCHANCATIASSFLSGLNRLDLTLYFGSIALMYLAPALMGLFWGAPLIAREFEAGTHQIAWTQSVTRTRWTLVKLGLIGLAAIAAAGLLSLMVTWWASPIDHAASLTGGPVQAAAVATGSQGLNTSWFVPSWIAPAVFAARGVAPLGYAAFAFALGVTAGVLLRRTLPAMAVTLTVFVVIQVLVPNLVRPHLLPPAQSSTPLSVQSLNISLDAGSRQIRIQPAGSLAPPGAWVLSDTIITPSGAPFTAQPQACMLTPASGPTGVRDCRNALAAMHLRRSVTYQPASRFWPLQWIETCIYLVLAVGLGWACVSQVRRRRAG
jgi:hypothetical protein